ncbi:MAG TPA: hypothetical protein VKE50_09760 [Thermoanaerobaculia bacterium]|nr:hypothetical protein [Thermoanaerobaculia bacterium]
MTPSRRTLRALPVVLLASLLAAPAVRAAKKGDDLLALVPADAASVAVVHLDQLRSSPLSAKLFADADHMTCDGEAAQFLAQANLDPKRDVDTVVIATEPGQGKDSPVLAVFTGRFEPQLLASAAEGRGAERRTSAAGDYELLPEKSENARRAAVAFVDTHLVIAGTEPAVIDALAARRSGATAFLSSGLGRQLSRVHRDAAAWALVDVNRYPALQRKAEHVHVHGEGESEPVAAVLSALKSVTLFAIDATPRSEGLDLAATGLVADQETRGLLEDSLRGLLAMWRLAVQDKSPEMVAALRKFQVASDDAGVTIRGTIPASVLRSMGEKKKAVTTE